MAGVDELIIEYQHDDFANLNSELSSIILELGDELKELEVDKDNRAYYTPHINKPYQCKSKMTNWDLSYRFEQAYFISNLVCNYVDRDFSPIEHKGKFIESWGVSYGSGNSIDWHCHGEPQGTANYSFAYYVKVPKNSSSLLFKSIPYKIEENWETRLDYYKDMDNGFPEYPILYECIPSEGKLVIWDAKIMHHVPPNNSKDRCAFIGNITLSQKE